MCKEETNVERIKNFIKGMKIVLKKDRCNFTVRRLESIEKFIAKIEEGECEGCGADMEDCYCDQFEGHHNID